MTAHHPDGARLAFGDVTTPYRFRPYAFGMYQVDITAVPVKPATDVRGSEKVHADFSAYWQALLIAPDMDDRIESLTYDTVSDFDWAGEGDTFIITGQLDAADEGDALTCVQTFLRSAPSPLRITGTQVRYLNGR